MPAKREREEIENIPQQALDVNKLFVAGLKHLEEADLQEHFSQFGNIVSCNIIMDRKSVRKRGFCFIEFDDTDAIDKVILHKKHEVKGVRMFVKKAVKWEEIKKSTDGFRSRGGIRGGRGRGGHIGDDYFDRRGGGYHDDHDGGRRGGRGGRGRFPSRRNEFSRGGNMYDSYRGGGGRRGYWDDRPPIRDFGRKDDDWDMVRSRRFRDDMDCGYGGDTGYGGGNRYGGGAVRSSFNTNRSAPYDTPYTLNRRGRY